jgi:hypothetical protein
LLSFLQYQPFISGALNELKELLGDAVTLVIETIEEHINCFFVQALQLDPKTLRLEAQ